MTNERIRKDERDFLAHHDIPKHYVADIRDRAEWASCAEFLRPLDCYVAWGFRRCAFGHRLTTARGRCIQCKPEAIGFMKGYWTEGYVYLLAAPSAAIVKVGWTGDVYKRLGELRSEKVGAIRDWNLVRYRLCSQPALLESALHTRLAKYNERRDYMRHQIPRQARELFACSRRTALRAWNDTVNSRSEW